MSEPQQQPPQGGQGQGQGRRKGYEFSVEVSDDRNRNVVWPLDQRLLRGRWTQSNLLGQEMDDRFRRMPDIPGLVLYVNTVREEAAILDPLNRPDHQPLLEKAVKVAEAVLGAKYSPEANVELKGLTDDEVKSWCYWSRRLVDARQAVVRTGDLPAMEQIMAMPGSVSFENHDQSSEVDRKRAPRRYVPMRHES